MATQPKNKAETSGTKTYLVQVPISHDQEEYAPGRDIDLTDKQAAPLLAVGAVANPADAA